YYADVDFNFDVVQVRITLSLGLPLRQHTASLHLEPSGIGQLADGTKDARPIFGSALLRQGCFDLQERHGRAQQQVPDASHYVVRLIWPGAGLSGLGRHKGELLALLAMASSRFGNRSIRFCTIFR